MPTVSVSLSDIGYEGYASISKGTRSKVIDRLLRDFALKRAHTVLHGEHMSIQQVLERQFHFTETMQQRQDEINRLTAELKELKE
jgi:hypothetical protein